MIRYISIFLAQRLSPVEFAHFFAPVQQKKNVENKGIKFLWNIKINQKNFLSESHSLAEQLAKAEAINSNNVADEDEQIDEFGSMSEKFMANLVQILTRIPIK